MSKIGEQNPLAASNRLRDSDILKQAIDAEQVDFLSLWVNTIKQWKLITLCCLAALVLSLLGTLLFVKTQYTASLLLEIAAIESISDDAALSKSSSIESSIGTELYRLQGAQLSTQVIKKLKLTEQTDFNGGTELKSALAQYKDSLSINKKDPSSTTSGLIHVQFQALTPELAMQVANTHASLYLEARQQTRDASLQQQKQLLTTEINTIKEQLNNTQAAPQASASYDLLMTNLSTLSESLFRANALLGQTEQDFGGVGSIIEKAYIPKKAVTPNLPLNVIIASFLGLTVGILIAIFNSLMGSNITNLNQLRNISRIEPLGELPQTRNKDTSSSTNIYTLLHDTPNCPFSEGIHSVKTALNSANEQTPLKSIAVTSSMSGEGTSAIAMNLAISYARTGLRVVLVEANFRTPTLSQSLELTSELTLAEYLASTDKQLKQLQAQTVQTVSNVELLPATKSSINNPVELLQSDRLPKLISRYEQEYDMVIIDCPAVANMADAVLLSKTTQGTLFVAAEGESKQGSVEKALRRLQMSNITILGSVLNKVSSD